MLFVKLGKNPCSKVTGSLGVYNSTFTHIHIYLPRFTFLEVKTLSEF